MSRGRLIGLAVAVGAALMIVAISYVSFAGPPPGTEDRAPIVGDSGVPATGGTLDASGLIAFWQARVERNPADYISYSELCAAYLRRARETGDVDSYGRAEAAVQRALELNPRYQTAITYLGTVQFAKHDFAASLETAQMVRSLNPGSAQAVALAGDASVELGDYATAQAAYDELSKISRAPAVLSRLARLADLNGRTPEAIGLLQKAAADADGSDSPAEARAWYHLQLANLYFNTGDLQAAENEYRYSLDRFPEYVHALAGLGRVAAARGNLEGSIDLYARVVQRYPVTEYVVALGDVYRATGRDVEAQQKYALVGAIDSLYKANGINTDLEIALYLADHDLRLHEAVAQARTQYERRPSIHAADVLAWALHKSGRSAEALDYSRQALRLGTRDNHILFHAAMIERSAGDPNRARDLLQQIADTNPMFSVVYAQEAAAVLAELTAFTGAR